MKKQHEKDFEFLIPFNRQSRSNGFPNGKFEFLCNIKVEGKAYFNEGTDDIDEMFSWDIDYLTPCYTKGGEICKPSDELTGIVKELMTDHTFEDELKAATLNHCKYIFDGLIKDPESEEGWYKEWVNN